MDLWTEFEGVTVDSDFALTKLLRSEGRSAFFSTLNANGESVLIRIIECHFDEDEILARWRGVQALGHPNFLRIDRFGQFRIEEDDITAVYAVFERVDENLGEVLERGCLSAADATQIGLSVASALEALHANGFVHEHIEARNIYAVGDDVKLRGDCIRQIPEGEAGMEARQRDVRELAVVLTQVLLGPARGGLLPAPFDDIVRNAMDGSWGLGEIKLVLSGHELPEARATLPDPVLMPDPAPMLDRALTEDAPSASEAASLASPASARDFQARAFSFDEPELQPETRPEPQPELSVFSSNDATHAGAATRAGLPPKKPAPIELRIVFDISERDLRRLAVAGCLLLALVLMGLIYLYHRSGQRAGAATQPVSAEPASASSAAPSASGSAAPALNPGSQSKVEWRVVAFTYNRQDQAQKKASSLAHRHPELSPTIFSPTGGAPWLVTVGGALDRDAAYALARKARSLGLPRDTYAQNYTVH
jgi:hypothetical protein